MWADNIVRRRSAQGGSATIEFALVTLVFFAMLFGVMEVARALYLKSTLQEVTRRAASMAAATDFSNAVAISQVRQSAVFRDSPGALMLGNPVTDANVQIEYLSLSRTGGSLALNVIPAASLPACPAGNVLNCTADPYGASCIRLVRVRICAAGGNGVCTPLQYQPLVALTGLNMTLPSATTIVPAGSLGFQPGMAPCF